MMGLREAMKQKEGLPGARTGSVDCEGRGEFDIEGLEVVKHCEIEHMLRLI